MKNIILFCLFLILTGCSTVGDKKIICNMEFNDNEQRFNLKIKTKFKNNKFVNSIGIYNFEEQELFENLCNQLKKHNDSANENDLIDYTCNDREIVIRNFTKINEDEQLKDMNIKEYVETMEKTGYTCK